MSDDSVLEFKLAAPSEREYAEWRACGQRVPLEEVQLEKTARLLHWNEATESVSIRLNLDALPVYATHATITLPLSQLRRWLETNEDVKLQWYDHHRETAMNGK